MLLGFTIVVFFYLFDLNNKEDMLIEYKEANTNCTFNGTVQSIEKWKGSSFILVNDKKIHLWGSHNYLYSPQSLVSFIKVGDSLLKDKGTDTLYIFRNDERYYFRLGKFINKHK